jgi:drug/metabolite transporter (DMT)-like permease
MGAPLLLFAIGQQHIDSSLAGMLSGAVPVFATVIAALLLRRSPGPRQIVGVAVGFVGVVAILWPATRGADATAFAIYLLPIVAIVLGVVFLDESVEPVSIAGTALVLFGAYLTSRSEVRGPATAAGVEAYRRS